MKFFDLELGSSLATATKKKGGSRDVYYMVVPGHYGCYGMLYTTSDGHDTSNMQKCNIQGEWHAFGPQSASPDSCRLDQ